MNHVTEYDAAMNLDLRSAYQQARDIEEEVSQHEQAVEDEMAYHLESIDGMGALLYELDLINNPVFLAALVRVYMAYTRTPQTGVTQAVQGLVRCLEDAARILAGAEEGV